jgi:hypothetical protein
MGTSLLLTFYLLFVIATSNSGVLYTFCGHFPLPHAILQSPTSSWPFICIVSWSSCNPPLQGTHPQYLRKHFEVLACSDIVYCDLLSAFLGSLIQPWPTHPHALHQVDVNASRDGHVNIFEGLEWVDSLLEWPCCRIIHVSCFFWNVHSDADHPQQHYHSNQSRWFTLLEDLAVSLSHFVVHSEVLSGTIEIL